jgi:hypothetical protein
LRAHQLAGADPEDDTSMASRLSLSRGRCLSREFGGSSLWRLSVPGP